MSKQVDLYNSTYGNFEEQVLAEVRRETYGEDIGQNSWITTDEYDQFYEWLNLPAHGHILEVASGSGGPSLYLARKFGCRITGIDINENGIETANKAAQASGAVDVKYQFADVDKRLPFDDATFDAVMCIDSVNHFRDRVGVLKEWQRVLKPGGRILFTDPVVITGAVTNEELAARSSIGFFIFMPLEWTEEYMKEAGFNLLRREDATANIELTSGRWHGSRARHRETLVKIEGEERFEGLKKFAGMVYQLTSERRLSRFVFLAQK